MVQPRHSVSKPTPRQQETLPPQVREISEKVKIICFGTIQNGRPHPWQRLIGSFRVGHPVNVEDMLDARGFEESADYA